MLSNTLSQSKTTSYLSHHACQTMIIRTESSLEMRPHLARFCCDVAFREMLVPGPLSKS